MILGSIRASCLTYIDYTDHKTSYVFVDNVNNTYNNNNNNNILFYSPNMQFNKNMFSALYNRCVQDVLARTCTLKNIHNNNRHIKQ